MQTPLGVLAKVRRTETGIDTIPLALTLVCAALIYVLSGQFVFAPGMYVEFEEGQSGDSKKHHLANISAATRNLTTPKTSIGDMARTSLTVTLVSARGAGVYVVAGRVVTRESPGTGSVVDRDGLAIELRRVAAAGGNSRPILLKADASLTMQSFLEVCELARNAKFPGVLIAADER